MKHYHYFFDQSANAENAHSERFHRYPQTTDTKAEANHLNHTVWASRELQTQRAVFLSWLMAQPTDQWFERIQTWLTYNGEEHPLYALFQSAYESLRAPYCHRQHRPRRGRQRRLNQARSAVTVH